ncbi:MAG TPA: hypothetical protein VHN17_07810 [Steroidobacteraceae bacterium]|nr:hypothetical protein [Steroidobacteraceae bacterium]
MTRRRLRLPAAIALLAVAAGHQISADLQHLGHSVHHWWDGVRTRVAAA